MSEFFDVLYGIQRTLGHGCTVSAQTNVFGTVDLTVSWYAHGRPFHHMASVDPMQLGVETARQAVVARLIAEAGASLERSLG